MPKSIYPKIKNYPKLYLWFSNYESGEHCNTVSSSAHSMATEIVEGCMENLKADLEGQEGKSSAEVKLYVFDKINTLEIGENCYFNFSDSSWMTITLIDPNSLMNIEKILANSKHRITTSKKKS